MLGSIVKFVKREIRGAKKEMQPSIGDQMRADLEGAKNRVEKDAHEAIKRAVKTVAVPEALKQIDTRIKEMDTSDVRVAVSEKDILQYLDEDSTLQGVRMGYEAEKELAREIYRELPFKVSQVEVDYSFYTKTLVLKIEL